MAEPSVIEQLIEAVGEDGARAVVRAYGGTRIKLPGRVGPDTAIAGPLGLDLARRLVEALGPGPLDVPTGAGRGHARRIDPAEVLTLIEAGCSRATIARRLGCTERHVYGLLRSMHDRRQPDLFLQPLPRDAGRRSA